MAQQAPDEETKGEEESTQVLKLVSVSEVRGESGAPIRMKHDIGWGVTSPVLQVTHFGYHQEENKVSYGTLVIDGCRLWNSKGEEIMRLALDSDVLYYDEINDKEALLENVECKTYSALAGVQKEDVTLLFLTGEDASDEKRGPFTAVWGIEDGMVELPEFKT
jgi:predicted phosphohydrolase